MQRSVKSSPSDVKSGEIAQTTVPLPPYLRSEESLRDVRVSSQSSWHDDVWVLDHGIPGQCKTRRSINWKVDIGDGTRLVDPQHAGVLNWLKRSILSLYLNPARGAPPSAGSATTIAQGMRVVVPWLVQTRRRKLSDITCAACQEFLDDLVDSHNSECGNELTASQVRVPVAFIQKLWAQGPIINIARAKEPPFNGRSAEQVVKQLSVHENGSIPPLPDEVAIPILNEAATFIEIFSNDIARLYESIRATRSRSGNTAEGHYYVQRKVAKALLLQTVKNARILNNEEFKKRKKLFKILFLVHSLRTACIIVVMSTAGIRISEVCGIPPGTDNKTKLPKCVTMRRSDDGLFDVFLLNSKLSKTERTPRSTQWVIGMRPVNSTELPLAVRALGLLNRISEIGGILGAEATSILAGRVGIIKSPDSKPHANLLSLAIQTAIKKFVMDWVDLSNLPNESRYPLKPNDLIEWRESKGRILKTHQFRKTFAQFATAIDARLIDAVKDQFKHMSLAMTNRYVNKEQYVALTSWLADCTTRTMCNMLLDDTPLAGILGEKLEQTAPDSFKKELKALPRSEAWKKIVHFNAENGLSLIHAPHGSCGGALFPTKMRCHEVAGTTDWMAREPNYQTREAALCAGCPCFVLDAQHKPFWRERYIANRTTELAYTKLKIDCRAIRARADQARNFLKRLGEEIGALDETVAARLAMEK